MCEICVACAGTPTKPPRDLHVIVGPSRDQLRCAIPTRCSGGGSQERRVRRLLVACVRVGPSDKKKLYQAFRAEAQYLTVRTKKRSRTLLTDCGCVHVLSIGRAFGRGRSAHSPSSPPSGASTHTHGTRHRQHIQPLMPPSTFTMRVSATQTYIRPPDLHARRYRCG